MNSDEIIARNNELFAELKKYPEDTKEYRDIAGKIVANNAPLVAHIAQRYLPSAKRSALNRDDLIAEGQFGLLKAIKPFNPEKGISFAYYAGKYIQNEILRRLKREQKHRISSLEDSVTTFNDGNQLKVKNVLAAPINIEADLVDKDERERQVAWIRNNLDRLPPFERKVLIAKYLS